MDYLQYSSIALMRDKDHYNATSLSPYFRVKKVKINYSAVQKTSFLVKLLRLYFLFSAIISYMILMSWSSVRFLVVLEGVAVLLAYEEVFQFLGFAQVGLYEDFALGLRVKVGLRTSTLALGLLLVNFDTELLLQKFLALVGDLLSCGFITFSLSVLSFQVICCIFPCSFLISVISFFNLKIQFWQIVSFLNLLVGFSASQLTCLSYDALKMILSSRSKFQLLILLTSSYIFTTVQLAFSSKTLIMRLSRMTVILFLQYAYTPYLDSLSCRPEQKQFISYCMSLQMSVNYQSRARLLDLPRLYSWSGLYTDRASREQVSFIFFIQSVSLDSNILSSSSRVCRMYFSLNICQLFRSLRLGMFQMMVYFQSRLQSKKSSSRDGI